VNAHRLAEERSIELHREVANVLRCDPTSLTEARERIRGWFADRSVHPRYAREWAERIDGPLDALLAQAAHADPFTQSVALGQTCGVLLLDSAY